MPLESSTPQTSLPIPLQFFLIWWWQRLFFISKWKIKSGKSMILKTYSKLVERAWRAPASARSPSTEKDQHHHLSHGEIMGSCHWVPWAQCRNDDNIHFAKYLWRLLAPIYTNSTFTAVDQLCWGGSIVIETHNSKSSFGRVLAHIWHK